MSLTKVKFSMIKGMMANVLDFGADPTGVSDSAAAINNAISTNKFVYMPSGTYLVNSPIDLKTHVKAGIYGESYQLVTIVAGAAMDAVIDIYDTSDIYEGISEYPVHNIKVDGGNLATNGVNIRHRHLVDIQNVYIDNCTTAIRAEDSWICSFTNLRSHTNLNGIHLEGANHNTVFNNCHIFQADGVPLYLGGVSKVDGNSDITFNNLLIDDCDTTQIVLDLGVRSNIATFNGGYIGEYANNTRGTAAIIKAISGKAIFNGTEIFAQDTAVLPATNGGMDLIWRDGGEAIFKDCSIALHSYEYVYNSSSTNNGGLTIEDCSVVNGFSYTPYLMSGIYDAFPNKKRSYKMTPKSFGRDMLYSEFLPSGSFSNTFSDLESQKIEATSTGGFASLSLQLDAMPITSSHFIFMIEYVSNVNTTLRLTSAPLGAAIWDAVAVIPTTIGTRSTFLGLLTNPNTFTNTPATLEIVKQAGTAWQVGDYIQLHKISLIPVDDVSYSSISLEY